MAPQRKPGRRKGRAQKPDPLRWLPLLAMVVLLVFVIKVRAGLLDIPLERDEGGFAYVAGATMEGAPLYTELRDTKLPGLYLVYGSIMTAFGADASGIHTGLLVFNLATIVLLFLFARRLFGNLAGVVAAASYAIMSVGPGILGFAAHATHFLLLPALGGVYLVWLGVEHRRWLLLFLAGVLFSLAFTIKQPAVHFMLFGGIYLLACELRLKERDWRFMLTGGSLLVLGSISLYVLTVLVMLAQGRFDAFWFWTFTWPSEFAATPSLSQRVELFRYMFGRLVEGQVWLWILGGLGVLLTLRERLPGGRKLLPYLLLFFTLAAVCTGFHFYPHYFVVVLVPVSLFIGLFVRFAGGWLVRRFRRGWLALVPILIFGLAWVQLIQAQPAYFFAPDHNLILRSLYGSNPFPESWEIGRVLEARRQVGDTMAIFGSEPQIYLYSDCEAASGHVFIYPLVDGSSHNTRLQDEMIQEIIASEPRFLVHVTAHASWLNRDPGNRLVNWMQQYSDEHYFKIGVADIFSNGTVYKWDEDARNYVHRSASAILVYERRP